MEGIVKFWNAERQFGFAVTEDGQEFYVGGSRFTSPAASSELLRLADLEGKKIQFDRQVKSSDDPWTDSLNEGNLRDLDGINPRNPHPPRRTWTGAVRKPVAVNIVLLNTASAPNAVGNTK